MDAQTQQRINAQTTHVRSYQNRITDLERSLALLRAKRTKTEEALYLHNKASSGYESDRQQNLQSASQLRLLSNIRLAQGYAESFTRMLSGAKSSQAFDAFNKIGASLRSELDRLDQEIRKKEAEINALQGQINMARKQISALLLEA